MAGESPGRGAVQTCGRECGEAQLSGASGDVFADSLQGSEIGDVSQGVTSLLQQSGVGDDAVGLVAVAQSLQLASSVVQVEVVGGQLGSDSGAVQIHCVIIPVNQASFVADVENGDVLDVSIQGVGVGAGSSSNDLDFDTGLSGVVSSQLLQSLVELGLEVQVVDGASFLSLCSLGSSGCIVASGSLGSGSLSGATSDQTQNHDQSQQQSDQFLHNLFLLNFTFAGYENGNVSNLSKNSIAQTVFNFNYYCILFKKINISNKSPCHKLCRIKFSTPDKSFGISHHLPSNKIYATIHKKVLGAII